MTGPMPMFPTFLQDTGSATPPNIVYLRHEEGEAGTNNGTVGCIEVRPLSLPRLVDLLDENDRDEGSNGPTQFAFRTAYLLVQEAEALVDDVLVSSPVVDSEGGIRITWKRGDRQVKLICPATREGVGYIYYSWHGGNNLRNQNITAEVLAERLGWLSNYESAAPDNCE